MKRNKKHIDWSVTVCRTINWATVIRFGGTCTGDPWKRLLRKPNSALKRWEPQAQHFVEYVFFLL